MPKITSTEDFKSFVKRLSVDSQYGTVEEAGTAPDAKGDEKKVFVYKGLVFRYALRSPDDPLLADGFHSKVEPVGKDHGEPLAKIGNILEYGRSDMSPQPWFNPTIARASDEVIEAIQKTFEEAQGHG